MQKSDNKTTSLETTVKVINQDAINKAVDIGRTAVASQRTKVDAVRMMYPLIINENPEVIFQTFIDGAGLTDKGAVTYWYNIRREHKKGKFKVKIDD